jgi:DNA-directed RNA polymerase specialized sigma24 family protein
MAIGSGSLKYDCDCNKCHELDYVLGLAIKGDAAALDQLFSSCMLQLQRTAARLLVNPQDSEDGLQEGLLSALVGGDLT